MYFYTLLDLCCVDVGGDSQNLRSLTATAKGQSNLNARLLGYMRSLAGWWLSRSPSGKMTESVGMIKFSRCLGFFYIKLQYFTNLNGSAIGDNFPIKTYKNQICGKNGTCSKPPTSHRWGVFGLPSAFLLRTC